MSTFKYRPKHELYQGISESLTNQILNETDFNARFFVQRPLYKKENYHVIYKASEVQTIHDENNSKVVNHNLVLQDKVTGLILYMTTVEGWSDQAKNNEHMSGDACFIYYKEDEIDLLGQTLERMGFWEHSPIKEGPKFYMISMMNDEFHNIRCNIGDIEVDIETHYNDGFAKFHEDTVNFLNHKESHGLILLHGEKGTGKSNYIHYLSIETKRKFIFLPPNMANYIADPRFISWLANQSILNSRDRVSGITGSVLVIEDAENVLVSRKSGTNQGVSNILNMTSGLPGKAMKIPIIATFNTNMENIDDALTRKGRLITRWEFNKLSVEKARKLAKKLGVDDNIKINRPMTLAEIYNAEKNNYGIKQKTQMGFGNRD